MTVPDTDAPSEDEVVDPDGDLEQVPGYVSFHRVVEPLNVVFVRSRPDGRELWRLRCPVCIEANVAVVDPARRGASDYRCRCGQLLRVLG